MGRRGLRYGMVSMCIGGGMGAAGFLNDYKNDNHRTFEVLR
jgi:hypothetical protein